MYALLVRLLPIARWLLNILDTWVAPLADLAIRVALFRVFFYAGLVKINDWNGTLQLFQFEYAVPLLPYALAAVMATTDELVCSTLVLVGLGSRLAALPLLVQAIVIQFSLGSANSAYNSLEHFLWMAMLLVVIARGPGLLSLDHQLRRRLLGNEAL
jgi:putative oxidoreductase